MNKFKVGDHVKIVTNDPNDAAQNATGVIREIVEHHSLQNTVFFDEPVKWMGNLYNYSYYADSELEPA